MDKNTIVKVANRNTNRVGYKIPELGVRRQFSPRETKEITFGELESLSYLPGGRKMLKNYLVVKDAEALDALGIKVEPEYFYSDEDIKRLLTTASLDEFLDCLDFAPDGVLDTVKTMAVDLPLDNVSKRKAILDKLGFNVTRAIEIQNTKLDGEADVAETKAATRRVAPQTAASESARRAAAPKYKVTSIQKQ